MTPSQKKNHDEIMAERASRKASDDARYENNSMGYYETLNGNTIPFENASIVDTTQIGDKHYITVFDTRDGSEHHIGQARSKDDAAHIASNQNTISRDMCFEPNNTPSSQREEERWEARKQEMAEEVSNTKTSHSPYLD